MDREEAARVKAEKAEAKRRAKEEKAEAKRKDKEAKAKGKKAEETLISSKTLVINNLANLRKAIFTTADDDACNRVESMIERVKNMPDNGKKEALRGLDNILAAIVATAILRNKNGEKAAVAVCIDVVDELINEREKCGDYYADSTFTNLRLSKIILQIDKAAKGLDVDEKIRMIDNSIEAFKAKYKD